MTDSNDPGPDAGTTSSDDAIFGIPVRPWDQPDQPTDHGIPGGLRPKPGTGGVHPGWASAPQDAYDDAVSGGWGVPGQIMTGPIPKIRREQPPPSDEAPSEGD